MSDFKQQLEDFSSKAEDIIDRVGQPLKPYIPVIGRFLIVVTFLEDALRISTQWEDQLLFMEQRRHFPSVLSHLFLGLNVIVSSIFLFFHSLLFFFIWRIWVCVCVCVCVCVLYRK